MSDLPPHLAKLLPNIIVPESIKIKQEVQAELLQKKREKSPEQRPKLRCKGDEVWEDVTMKDWPDDDYRVFISNLGNEVTEELLGTVFRKWPSFQRSRVIRNKFSNKTRGYGFLSFGKKEDYVAAMREMNGKYIGNRQVIMKVSKWKDQVFTKKSIKGMKMIKKKLKVSKKMAKGSLDKNLV